MNLKRFGCTVTACLLVLGAAVIPTGESSVLPMTAKVSAEIVPSKEYEFVKQQDGTYAISAYIGSSEKVNLPKLYYETEEIKVPVTAVLDNAFEGNSTIKVLNVPSSYTSIGEKAFYGCTALTEATFSAKVQKIGEKAFLGCKNLTTVTVKGKNTVIGENAFERSNRTGIKIYCITGSNAADYAKRNMISFSLLDADGSCIYIDHNTDDMSLIPEIDDVFFNYSVGSSGYGYGFSVEDECAAVPANIPDGDCEIQFGSSNGAFTPRTYNVTIKDGKVTEPFTAVLNLKGDINGDKKLNASDLLKAKSHIKGVARLGGYEFDCANIDGNTVINASDLLKMKSHIKGVKSLWTE